MQLVFGDNALNPAFANFDPWMEQRGAKVLFLLAGGKARKSSKCKGPQAGHIPRKHRFPGICL
jgi:hypothetical protein